METAGTEDDARNSYRVLLVEPFYGGSHKQLIDLLAVEIPRCHVVSLTAKKWHWRARSSALYLSQTIPLSHNYEVLFTSSVLNLSELVALRPDLSKLRKILYFHENQLVYPVRKQQHRDFQYGYNQILSCLVADVVIFNSNYNKESFLTSIQTFLKTMPDYRPKGVAEQIRPKCRVLYFPIRFPTLPLSRPCNNDDKQHQHMTSLSDQSNESEQSSQVHCSHKITKSSLELHKQNDNTDVGVTYDCEVCSIKCRSLDGCSNFSGASVGSSLQQDQRCFAINDNVPCTCIKDGSHSYRSSINKEMSCAETHQFLDNDGGVDFGSGSKCNVCSSMRNIDCSQSETIAAPVCGKQVRDGTVHTSDKPHYVKSEEESSCITLNCHEVVISTYTQTGCKENSNTNLKYDVHDENNQSIDGTVGDYQNSADAGSSLANVIIMSDNRRSTATYDKNVNPDGTNSLVTSPTAHGDTKCTAPLGVCSLVIRSSTKPLHIVWPHRWEHDKNPELFFTALETLKNQGMDFVVSILGEIYTDVPKIFEESKECLSGHILHWGFLKSKKDYYDVLYAADVVVSTADHEFFGVAMLEAVHCGCYPIAPKRLVYPEIFADEFLYNTPAQLIKKLKNLCKRPLLARHGTSVVDCTKYSWENLGRSYYELFH